MRVSPYITFAKKHARMIFYFLTTMLLLLTTTWSEDKDYFHIEEPTGFSSKPVRIAQIDKRLVESAIRLYKRKTISTRLAQYDIAFPKNPDEFQKLKGYGLLAITAVTQDSSELPLKRVFIKSKHKEIPLRRLYSVSSRIPKSIKLLSKILGQYRTDAMYVFPVYYKFQESVLLADFARNRENLHLATFPGKIPAALQQLPQEEPDPIVPIEALQVFSLREYPDLKRFLKKGHETTIKME